MRHNLALAGLTGAVVHDEVVPACAPWSHNVRRGQTLRIVDLEGNQAADTLFFSAADPAERYSAVLQALLRETETSKPGGA